MDASNPSLSWHDSISQRLYNAAGISPFYSRDNILIFNADCRDVLSTIDPGSVDLLLTDPPYGVRAVETNGRTSGQDVRPGHVPGTWKQWTPIDGDDAEFDPTLLLEFPRLIIFGANNFAHLLPPSKAWIVWDRLNGSTPADNADAELIWTNLGGTTRMYRQTWRGFSRENDSLEPQKHLHPTQKPINLMLWLLERYTKPNDVVLDPYMGSGPIAKACQLLNRRYIGIEINKDYCVKAYKRLQQTAMKLEVA